MAIVEMSVFTLFSPVAKREMLLRELQQFEDVHFRDMTLIEEDLSSVEDPHLAAYLEEGQTRVNYLLNELKAYDSREKGLKATLKGLPSYSLEALEKKSAEIEEKELFEQVKALRAEVDGLNQKLQSLKTTSDELEPWEELSFEVSKLQDTAVTKVQAGSFPRRLEESFKEALLDYPDVYYEKVSEGSGQIYGYFLYLKEQALEVEDLLRRHGFSAIDLEGEDRAGKEREKLALEKEKVLKEKALKEEELKKLALKLNEIEVLYEYYENLNLKYRASKAFVGTDHVDISSGFIPSHRKQEFEKQLQETLKDEYYLEVKEVDPEDDVPVMLKNNALAESFSGVTGMYAMPKYNEIDPTPLLAPFYWLFFGMMGADIGYGILLLILSALVLKFVPLKEGMKKNLKFFFYLSFGLIFWGVIYGSFFGGLIKLPNLIDTNKDFTTLLILSVGLGIVHLFFGLGIKGYMLIRDKKYLDAIYDVLFWYMAIAGAIVFFLAGAMDLGGQYKMVGKWVMIIGMAGIVLFGGRAAKSLFGRLGSGVYELYGISGYIGDIVSYSRLMALGLSGGFIALSVNIIVGMVIDKGIIGLIFGVIIFVVFHLFNIFLSMLSAYVHTSRLTYVEFFGKFYEGGGKAFKPFRTEPKYIEIENSQGGRTS